MTKVIIIFLLLINVATLIAQGADDETDPKPKQVLDFSTNGIYLSGGFMSTGIEFNDRYIKPNTQTYSSFHNAYLLQAQLEFKHNIAIKIEYSFTPRFNVGNWRNAKNTMIGFSGHLPCYSRYKHKGIYIESGFSLEVLEGEHSFANNSLMSSYKQNSLKMLNGLGYEYKLKRLQLFSMTRLKSTLLGNIPSDFLSHQNKFIVTLDFIIGLRLKISEIQRKPKNRYHWF